MSARFAVDDLWIGHRYGPTVLEEVAGRLRPVESGLAAVQRSGVPMLPGAVMPGLVDRHVHLGLIAAAALSATPVVGVHDLGWIPRVGPNWKMKQPTGGGVKMAGADQTAG